MSKKFQPLDYSRGWDDYWRDHPKGYSPQEQMINWSGQLNAMIDFFNEYFDVDLTEYATAVMEGWYFDGRLDDIINDVLFDSKADKTTVDSLISQLAESVTNTSEIVTNVKSFGAKGDGVTDDTTAIQSAIDYFLNNNVGELFFPSGTYMISSPLNCYKNGRYVQIRGTGRRDSTIVAKEEMPYMIKLWEENSYFSATMRDIGFNLSDKADMGIDAFKTIYSTFDNISVWGYKTNATLLKVGSWCNRVKNSLFHGDYILSGISPVDAIKISTNLATNNLIIEDNVFENLDVATHIDGYANDVQILKNTFDRVGKIILAKGGLKNVSFHYNYCEACGGVNNTQYVDRPYVYTDGAYTKQLLSPFILHEQISMTTDYPVNISIKYNQFANCYKKHLVALSCAKDVIFSDNDFHMADIGSETYDELIYLFGKGIFKGNLEVQNRMTDITNIVVYDTNYAAYYKNSGTVTIDEPRKAYGVVGSRKNGVPTLSDVPITPSQEIVVNTTDKLNINYELSEFDRKHPHRIIISADLIGGTKLIASMHEGANNILFNQDIAIVENTGAVHQTTERTTMQYKNLRLTLSSDGDVKINGVWLEVANAKTKYIQLV